MPSSKHWFKVSHYINRDEEMWAMRDAYGEKALAIWLECLSIGQRSGGLVFKDKDSFCRTIAHLVRSKYRTTTAVVDACYRYGWLVVDAQNGFTILAKLAKYKKGQEHDKTQTEETEQTEKKENIKDTASAAPPETKIAELRPQTEVDPLTNLAVEIGGIINPQQQKFINKDMLVKWTISMVRGLKSEPPERTAYVVKTCLEDVRRKLLKNYPIHRGWGLLNTIFESERTKYIQGIENNGYKRMGDLESIGSIITKAKPN